LPFVSRSVIEASLNHVIDHILSGFFHVPTEKDGRSDRRGHDFGITDFPLGVSMMVQGFQQYRFFSPGPIHNPLFFDDDVDAPGAQGFIAKFHCPGLAECSCLIRGLQIQVKNVCAIWGNIDA
jgi:hypothetical protein